MTSNDADNKHLYDIAIIGGGINGCGIARDAAGRGLSVYLAEQNDLASATSSWSTKLIHGGLRYLEHYAFRLVRESLQEREVLLRLAPHIIHPLSFVVPHVREMRPAWMMRAGLFIYDRLGGRSSLPRSQSVQFPDDQYSMGLKPSLKRAFVYADARVDDARLALINAMSAAALGASINTRCKVVRASRVGAAAEAQWQITVCKQPAAATSSTGEANSETIRARALINAAGPWVQDVQGILEGAASPTNAKIKLVKGSHIIVPRVHTGEHAMLLQNDDGRICFVIPYEDRFSLIGTTDVVVHNIATAKEITEEEIRYLLRAANRYLSSPLQAGDVVWSYAGVRPLYDDGATNAAQVTRDYVLQLDAEAGQAPLLSIYGGKITTYRRLAEHSLQKLTPFLPAMQPAWTAGVPLPGADFAAEGSLAEFIRQLQRAHTGIPPDYIERLVLRHGTATRAVLRNVRALDGLGELFGRGRNLLAEREIDYFIAHEWATSAEDILWRRSKCGLHMDDAERARATAFIEKKLSAAAAR
jgi:glycerol-3-phosphate dehydrogenase